MKTKFKPAIQKKTKWPVSIIAFAMCLMTNINLFAQAPPPTNPYVANVLNFGATANDETNDTQAIQNAVNWLVANHPGGTVLVPNGTYMIDALTSVLLQSNMTFRLESGAVLKAKPTNSAT